MASDKHGQMRSRSVPALAKCALKGIQRRAASGFTLLELSVVIIIIALLVGSTVTLGTLRIEQEKINATKTRLELIENAMKAYIEVNKRLPCPAYPTLNTTHAEYSREIDDSANPGTCQMAGMSTSTFRTPKTFIGVVPVTTLGLPLEAMYDSWGRKITYTAFLPMTRKNAFAYNRAESACGGITIRDNNNNTNVNNAIYALISHGVDGHGAYNKSGVMVNGATYGNPPTLENANITSATSMPASRTDVYHVRSFYINPANPQDRFDDILAYKARKDMRLASDSHNSDFNINNNISPSGWLYVPQHTLPSGKVVPAFEVMKYLASDDPVTGKASSVPGVAPTGKSYKDARLACQRLGGYTTDASGNPTVTGRGAPMEYDIISETQWLSLAHQVTEDSRNWESGCYADGKMMIGHRDNSPASIQNASSNDADGYFGTGNSGDASQTSGNTEVKRTQRRTFYLPNGSVIWDVSGNMRQWTYCDLNYKAGESKVYAAARAAAGLPDEGFSLCLHDGRTNISTFSGAMNNDTGQHDYNFAGCETLPTSHYGQYIDISPRNGLSGNMPDGSNLNVGGFTATSTSNVTAIRRGDHYTGNNRAGVFTALLGNTSTSPATGYRCVRNFEPKKASPDNFSGLKVWYDASDINADWVVDKANDINDPYRDFSEVNTHASRYGNQETGDGAILQWRNRAMNEATHDSGSLAGLLLNRYHAFSQGSSSDDSRPSIRYQALNGKAAIQFNEHYSYGPQYLTTGPSGWDSNTFDFTGLSEYTLFVVGNASKWNAVISAVPTVTSHFPHFLVFPYDISLTQPELGLTSHAEKNYVFLVDNQMAGTDASNTYCRFYGSTDECALSNTAGNKRSYACAQMGGIDSAEGLTANKTHILSGVFHKGISKGMAAYVDGSVMSASSSVTPDNTDFGKTTSCPGGTPRTILDIGFVRWGARWGANAHTGNGPNTVGSIAEILIYDRALSASDRRKVEEYLADKYSMELAKEVQ